MAVHLWPSEVVVVVAVPMVAVVLVMLMKAEAKAKAKPNIRGGEEVVQVHVLLSCGLGDEDWQACE